MNNFLSIFRAHLSYNIHQFAGSMLLAHIRMGLAILCTICFIIVAVTGVISHILFKGKDPRKWYPSDGGLLLYSRFAYYFRHESLERLLIVLVIWFVCFL